MTAHQSSPVGATAHFPLAHVPAGPEARGPEATRENPVFSPGGLNEWMCKRRTNEMGRGLSTNTEQLVLLYNREVFSELLQLKYCQPTHILFVAKSIDGYLYNKYFSSCLLSLDLN